MKNLILYSLFLVLSGKIISQELPEFLSNENFETKDKMQKFYQSDFKKIKNANQLQSEIIRRPYNVIKYDVTFDWVSMMEKTGSAASDKIWTGINKIDLIIDSSNVKSLEFDCLNQEILTVKVNSIQVINFQQPSDGLLLIPLSSSPKIGDNLQLEISYKYIGTNNIGFNLYPKGQFVGTGPTGDTVIVEERLAYLMNEPEDARNWMPCNDRPYDKALMKFTVKMPYGYKGAANGSLLSVAEANLVRTEIWSCKDEMPTYLMHLAVSKFYTYSDIYKGKNGDIPVVYFVWPKDSSNEKTDYTVYNAKNAFRNTVKMMEVLSNKLIEYPYEKYGMDAVQPFWAGGMEHQTLTTVNRVWLRGTSESGIAHELGHQWLGDLITCATWKDIWINEGGATWTEALWAEKDGFGSYIYTIKQKRSGYLNGGGNNLPRIYSLPMNDLFNTALTYYKSSWIYHMLRMHLGDSLFFSTLRGLLNEYHLKSLETEEFKNYFKKSIPSKANYFDIFFDQWIMQAGHPEFSTVTKITPAKNGYLGKVNVQQVQKYTGVPDVFKTQIRLIATDTLAKTSEYFDFYIDQSSQDFEVNLKNIPHTLMVDNSYTLCTNSNFVLSVLSDINDTKSNDIIIAPNPLKTGEYLNISIPENINNFNLEIYDLLGKRIFVSQYSQHTISILLNNIQSGNYQLVITNGSDKIFKSIIIY